MFRAMFSSIIKSTWLYLQYVVVFTPDAAGWCRQQLGWTLPDTVNTVKCYWWWAKHRLKHVELTWNNKLIYIVHLVGYFHSCIKMHGFMNVESNVLIRISHYHCMWRYTYLKILGAISIDTCWILNYTVWAEDFTDLLANIKVLWDVTPCRLVICYLRVGGASCLCT